MHENIISDYCNLTSNCEINSLTSIFAYYLADKTNNHISVKSNQISKIIDIDIRAAYPTICKILYGIDHPFVQKIFSFENKLEKNKYICITLTHNKDMQYKISDINTYCKIIIFGYIYTLFDNITILEYKKDGVLFIGDVKLNITRNSILDLIDNYEVKFSQKELKQYIRYNRTSIYYDNDNISIKGLYKNLPEYILNIIQTLNITSDLAKIYSNKYFNILRLCNFKDLLNKYYSFNDSFLTNSNHLSQDITSCHPPSYLIYVIYPFLRLINI